MALNVGELYASFTIDSSGLDTTMKDIEDTCSQVAGSMAKAGAGMSVGLTTPIVSFGKSAFETGKGFEAQMSRVGAIAEATGTELDILTQNAIELGAATVFSSTEAAEGMENLASAGFSVNEIIAAMPGMLDLAASSGADLATSASIAASTVRSFGLDAEQTAHVADVLAKNAANTNAEIVDTGYAMKYIAPVAHAMGISLEEATACIGLLADNGIKGTQAGTTLKNALTRLAKPTEEMNDVMSALNLEFYDGNGKMKSYADIVSMLETNLSGLTEEQRNNALVTLFGSGTLPGILALMNAGSDKIRELTEAYKNCDGAADEMATTMLDNLAGALESLDGSMETLKLDMYYAFLPSLKDAVSQIDGLVSSFNGLDDATKMGAYKIAGMTAAIGPMLLAGSGFIKVVQGMIPALAAIASPLGVAMLGIGMFAAAAIDANNDIGNAFVKGSQSINKSLKKINSTLADDIKTISKRMPALSASLIEGIQNIVPEFMNTAMIAITGLMDALSENADEIADVGQTIITSLLNGISSNLPNLVKSGVSMVTSIVTALAGNMPSIVEAAGNIALALGDGIRSVDWVDIVSQLTSAFTSTVDGLTGVLSTLFSNFKQQAGTMNWASIGTQIIDLVLSATVSATTSIGTFLSNLIRDIGGYTGWDSLGTQFGTIAEHLITGIADAIPQVADTVAGIITSIGTALSGDGVKSLEEGFKTFATSVISGIGTAIPKIADGASTIITAIGNLLSGDSSKGLIDCFTDLASSIIGGIVEQIPNVANAAVNIVGAIGGLFTADGAVKSIFDGAANIASSIIGAVCDAIPTIGQAAIDIVSAIGKLFTQQGAAKTLNDGATNIATSLLGAVTDAIPSLTDTVKGIVTALGDTLATVPWADNIGNLTSLGQAIFSAIAEAIRGAGSIATSIVEALGTAFSGIQWDDVSLNLDAFADMVLNGIVNGLGAMAEAGATVLNAISTALGNIKWEDVTDTISGFAKKIFEGIVEGAKNLTPDLSEVISALGRGIKAAGTALGTVAGNLIGDLVTYITDINNLTRLVELGGDILRAIAAGIANLAESILTGAWNAVVGVFKGLFQSLGLIASDEAQEALDTVVEVVNTEGELISGKLVEIVNHLDANLGGVGEKIFDANSLQAAVDAYNAILNSGSQEVIDSMSNYSFLANETAVSLFSTLIDTASSETEKLQAAFLLKELGLDSFIGEQLTAANLEILRQAEQMSVNGKNAAANFIAAFEGLGLILPEAIKSGLLAGTTSVQEAAAQILAIASTANNQAQAEADASATGGAVSEALAIGEESGTPKVEEATSALEIAATVETQSISATATEAGLAVAQGIADGETTNTPLATAAADTLADETVKAVLAKMNYSEGYKLGYDYVVAVKSGISAAQQTATAQMSTTARSIASAASSALSSGAGSSIGLNFAHGIAQGIRNGSSAIRQAAISAASAALEAAKSRLGIHSPSAVAEKEIGWMWDEGLANGVIGRLQVIENAAAQAASLLHDSFMIGDPSRGTIYTDSQSISQTAKQTAEASNEKSRLVEHAQAVGKAIADRLIEAGVFEGDVVMDGTTVGKKVSKSVSKTISIDALATVKGRATKGVIY